MNQIKVKGTPGRGLLGTTLGFFFGFAAVSLYGPTAIKFKEAMGSCQKNILLFSKMKFDEQNKAF